MQKPLDGAVSAYFETGAPDAVRDAVRGASKGKVISASYPYKTRLKRAIYDERLNALQIELVKLQAWTRQSGARIAVVFEGRDAAGKGGTIKRFRQNLNPRTARVVALPKPSDREGGQWYFQRYVQQMPAAGEIVFFDRSWYNRGVVEKVFGFCSDRERELFFDQVNDVERMFVSDGIILVKLWLNVGRAEQLRRMLKREADPLKHWKLSRIDVEGLRLWDAYTDAIGETLTRTHAPSAPWSVLRTDDKRRARVQALRTVLERIDYSQKDHDALGSHDPGIIGGPEIWSSSADPDETPNG